ncbi:MAG: GNAT family N-acetyltransferase [Amaricoccus sp.]
MADGHAGRDRRRGRRHGDDRPDAAPSDLFAAPPAVLRPQAGLRERVVGAQHITFLGTVPRFRRRGVGRALLGEAERQGAGAFGLSVIVSDQNAAAWRLYETFGLREVARVTAVKVVDPRLGADAEALVGMRPLHRRAAALHWKTAGSSLPVKGPNPSGRKHS